MLASYPIAAVTPSASPELGHAFVELVLSPAGQKVLVAHGLLPAPATGALTRPAHVFRRVAIALTAAPRAVSRAAGRGAAHARLARGGRVAPVRPAGARRAAPEPAHDALSCALVVSSSARRPRTCSPPARSRARRLSSRCSSCRWCCRPRWPASRCSCAFGRMGLAGHALSAFGVQLPFTTGGGRGRADVHGRAVLRVARRAPGSRRVDRSPARRRRARCARARRSASRGPRAPARCPRCSRGSR